MISSANTNRLEKARISRYAYQCRNRQPMISHAYQRNVASTTAPGSLSTSGATFRNIPAHSMDRAESAAAVTIRNKQSRVYIARRRWGVFCGRWRGYILPVPARVYPAAAVWDIFHGAVQENIPRPEGGVYSTVQRRRIKIKARLRIVKNWLKV